MQPYNVCYICCLLYIRYCSHALLEPCFCVSLMVSLLALIDYMCVCVCVYVCRKHTLADDKADLRDIKERFLKGEVLS